MELKSSRSIVDRPLLYLISLCVTCLLQCGQNLLSSIRAVVLRRFLVDV